MIKVTPPPPSPESSEVRGEKRKRQNISAASPSLVTPATKKTRRLSSARPSCNTPTIYNIQEEMDYEREEYQTGLSDEESSDDEQDEEDGLPDI